MLTFVDERPLVYRAEEADGDVSLREYEPAARDPFAALLSAADKDARVEAAAADPFIVRIPSFWVRSADGPASAQARASSAAPQGAREIYLAVDRERLTNEIVPRLVRDYLGNDPRGLQATVVDLEEEAILFSTTVIDIDRFLVRRAEAEAPAPRDPVVVEESTLLNVWPGSDIVAGRESGYRLAPPAAQNPLVRQWLALRELGEPDDDAPTIRRLVGAASADQIPDSGIALLIWHAAGSIERAALGDRNRNLVVSLLVLAAFAAFAVTFHALFVRVQQQRTREQEFVASVTHELRTPVAAMHAAAENLAQGIVIDEARVREYGRALLDEAQRLRGMIDQTLFFAGLRSEGVRTREPIDLEDVAHRALLTVPEIDPARVCVRIDEGTPIWRGDRAAVESVVTNLIANAVRHNPPGTSVTLTAERDVVGGSAFVRIVVADDGVGIARADLARVREPFFRGRRSRSLQTPGTGLGLAIVQRIVTIGGGKLDIKSNEGRGTTVTVLLPY